MGKETGIAWTDHTANPWIGCTEVSPGCDNCYARVMDARYRYGGATHWGAGVPRFRSKSFFKVVTGLDTAAFQAGVKRRIFPSLCDPFDNEVPEEWREDLFDVIAETPSLIWLLLTKRIGNAKKMMPFTERGYVLPNMWLGASVVNQEEADRDIPKLLATPAVKRFVSYEPALGPIDFVSAVNQECNHRDAYMEQDTGAWICRECENNEEMPGIDWIIVGGESNQGGAKARPFDLAWARSTVSQCKAAGVPVFVKQLGSFPKFSGYDSDSSERSRAIAGLKDRAGADPAEWPEDLRVQEFPT